MGRPLNASFELTPRCNFNCRMCYIHRADSAKLKERELSTEKWLSLADEAADMGVLILLLTGGEPTIREDFDEIYTYCKRKGFSVHINTNGSLIDDKKLELFKRLPPTRINLSLYGFDKETYKTINGCPEAFEKSKEAALRLREAGIQTALSFSVTQYNLGDMENAYAFARENSFNCAAATYMYPAVRVDGKADRLSPEDSALATLACSKYRWGDKFRIDENALRELTCPDTDGDAAAEPCGEPIRCRAAKSSFWLTWDGIMTPCGMMPLPKADVKEASLEEAWAAVREESAAIRTPAKCAACPDKKACNYCAASCYAETGSFSEAPDYLCRRTRKYIELITEEANEIQSQ